MAACNVNEYVFCVANLNMQGFGYAKGILSKYASRGDGFCEVCSRHGRFNNFLNTEKGKDILWYKVIS